LQLEADDEASMTVPTLHYVHDPLCGWCYAVTPMVEAVANAGIPIVLHGGGLWEPATGLVPTIVEARVTAGWHETRLAGPFIGCAGVARFSDSGY